LVFVRTHQSQCTIFILFYASGLYLVPKIVQK
jgi:hypothetical protein